MGLDGPGDAARAGREDVSSETPGMPTGSLDHFVCYLVPETGPRPRPLTLVDQFDEKLDRVERVTEMEPAFFGVPVEKNGEPIVNEAVHLAIYDITPVDILKQPLTVWTKDQLRPSVLNVQQSLLLALAPPSARGTPSDILVSFFPSWTPLSLKRLGVH